MEDFASKPLQLFDAILRHVEGMRASASSHPALGPLLDEAADYP
jgi:hypothetical protein